MKSVFVSSTFKDMQSERDMLQYLIYPCIRNDLSKFGENLNILDLRWGVDTLDLSEEESGKVVLKVCIDAIDRCVPYIIVFLGERYGWIPEKEVITKTNDVRVDRYYTGGMSITNLEIEYGAFSERCSIEKCIFCFRNPSVNEKIDAAYRPIYESESEIHRQKLKYLKDRIRQETKAAIIEYDASWDEENHKITGLDKLQEQLYEMLRDKILDDFKNKQLRSPYQQMKVEMELTKQQYLSTYAKRYADENQVMDEIIRNVVGYKDAKNIHIRAEAGTGKTTLMSGLVKVCEEAHMKTILCYGGINGCHDYRTLKEYVTYQLEELLEEEHIKSTASLNERLIELNGKIEDHYKVICFLDAVDQIFDSKEIHIDLLDLCPKVVFVISSVREVSLINNNLRCMEIDGLTKEQITDMIMNTTAQRGKILNADIVELIKERDNAANPLYLSNVLQRLFMMSAKEFEAAEKLAPGIEGIHQYMQVILEKVPEDKYEIIEYLMKETAAYFQNEEFQQIVSLIDISKDGLSENELREILALKGIRFNSLLFYQIVTYLYDVFVQKNNGKWAFKHRLFRKVMKNDREAMDLLCRYALLNEAFLNQEGLYYLVENKHEKGYLLFERERVYNIQSFMLHLIKKEESYREYLVRMAQKADGNLCFEKVCSLEHEELNQIQKEILDELYTSGTLSEENRIRYVLKKISMCNFMDKIYFGYIKQLQKLDEESYYYELAYCKWKKGFLAEAEAEIRKAMHLAEQKKKSEESVLRLFNYVKRLVMISVETDPREVERYLELLGEYSKDPLSKPYGAEIRLCSDLAVLYTQKKYFDVKKVIAYRDESIKKAELLANTLLTVNNLDIIIEVYENAIRTVKKEYRQEYVKACVKYMQRKYELTRQDADRCTLALKLKEYAECINDDAKVTDLYEKAMESFKAIYLKHTEISSICKSDYLCTKASLAFYMLRSEEWETRKKAVSLLQSVVEDEDFEKLKYIRKLEYLDVLMEYWIQQYRYEQAAVWIDAFEELCQKIIPDRKKYLEHAWNYRNALQQEGKTDREYLQQARDFFVDNQYKFSVETYERMKNKELMEENDRLSIMLSEYMIQYLAGAKECEEIPEVEIEEKDYFTKTLSVLYLFTKMRKVNEKQTCFLKAIRTLLFDLSDDLMEEKIERMVVPKLICFLKEFDDFESLDFEKHEKTLYRIPVWVYTFFEDKTYVHDILYRFAKLYEDRHATIAESFYLMASGEYGKPLSNTTSTGNSKEDYEKNFEKLKRVVRLLNI